MAVQPCLPLVLALDGGKAYSDLIMLLVISHIPVFIIDSIVSVGVVLLLNKMYPTALSVGEMNFLAIFQPHLRLIYVFCVDLSSAQ